MKIFFILFILSSCSIPIHSNKCTKSMDAKELIKRGTAFEKEDQQHHSKNCYEFSCYKKDLEGCYKYAMLIGYENKRQSDALMKLICSEGYSKACPSKHSNKEVYQRSENKNYSPNQNSSLKSWASLLGETLERNVNRD